MLIDKNNILCVSEILSQMKEYSHNTDGYRFSDYDKMLLVLHKGEFREINLKDLGNNMSVIYIADRAEIIQEKLNIQGFNSGLCMYDAFDEDKGEVYYFLPKIAEKDIESLNNVISKFTDVKLVKNNKGVCLNKNKFNFDLKTPLVNDVDQIVSFLFAMTMLYGKLDIKNSDLKSFKIHINLFAKYLIKQDMIEKSLGLLAKNGIFVNASIQKSKMGITYQITSSDYELLRSFAKFYQSVENINQISKYDFVLDLKIKLIDYIKKNSKDSGAVLDRIEKGTVKILTK